MGTTVSSAQRPVMTRNILKCIGQLPTTRNYPFQNVNSTKVETFSICDSDSIYKFRNLECLLMFNSGGS